MKLIWGYVVLGFAAVACGDSNDNNLNHLPDGGTATDVVTKTTPEPAGSNCQYGGTEVQVGVDANGNGALDPDEVQSTFYICDQAPTPDPLADVYYGELVITSAADIAAAQSYTGVVGDLIVMPSNDTQPLDVELPNLTFVAGEITDCGEGGDQAGIVAARAPKLAPVPQSETVSLAALQTAGSIDFECGQELESLTFPALTAIHGDLTLLGSEVTGWSAPVLASVEESTLVLGTSLTTLTLPPAGEGLGAQVTIEGNASLDDCAMDELAGAIRRAGFRGQIVVDENGAGSGSGSGSGDEVGCTDVTHICQPVTIGGDATDWRECMQSTDFTDARSMCQGLGSGWDLAYLASLDDEHTTGGFSYMAARYWIGYYQASESAPYTWVQEPTGQTFAPQSSSDPTDGAFWSPGEPTGDENPDCVQIFLSDSLDPTSVVANDVPCENDNQPLCRYVGP
ncbi:MAG TPA: C-type lectin domain-containing protein [Kofleriaceae bacterium]|jgi:hypothetical protein